LIAPAANAAQSMTNTGKRRIVWVWSFVYMLI
jgi:hypothetical protein